MREKRTVSFVLCCGVSVDSHPLLILSQRCTVLVLCTGTGIKIIFFLVYFPVVFWNWVPDFLSTGIQVYLQLNFEIDFQIFWVPVSENCNGVQSQRLRNSTTVSVGTYSKPVGRHSIYQVYYRKGNLTSPPSRLPVSTPPAHTEHR
jgi:hypothetical protein